MRQLCLLLALLVGVASANTNGPNVKDLVKLRELRNLLRILVKETNARALRDNSAPGDEPASNWSPNGSPDGPPPGTGVEGAGTGDGVDASKKRHQRENSVSSEEADSDATNSEQDDEPSSNSSPDGPPSNTGVEGAGEDADAGTDADADAGTDADADVGTGTGTGTGTDVRAAADDVISEGLKRMAKDLQNLVFLHRKSLGSCGNKNDPCNHLKFKLCCSGYECSKISSDGKCIAKGTYCVAKGESCYFKKNCCNGGKCNWDWSKFTPMCN